MKSVFNGCALSGLHSLRSCRFFGFALALVVIASLSLAQTPQRTPGVGQLAPAFTAKATDGRSVSLADYKGKVVLVEFWATFCTTCVADLPTVKTLYEKYSPKGLNIIGVSMDQDPAALRTKVETEKLPWTQLMDGKSFDGELPHLYSVDGTPTYFVVDRNGRVALRTGDSKKLESAIAAAVSPAADSQQPNRDSWQHPAYVMDELGITSGSSVADVGAGDGYFTMHLADRVGSQGRVYAVDINPRVLQTIDSKASARGLNQVVTILGTDSDPRLPDNSLDAILIVNAYHEMIEFDTILRAMNRALKPGGRLGIIDATAEVGFERSRYQRDHHIPESLVREDAVRNGFKFRNKGEDFPNREWYFAIFIK